MRERLRGKWMASVASLAAFAVIAALAVPAAASGAPGAVAALEISAPATVLANGASSYTVTVDVVDANGDVVSGNSDEIGLTSSNASAAAVDGSAYAAAVDGVATFTITSGTVAGASTTLTATDESDASLGATSYTATVTTTMQQATSLSVSPETPYVSGDSGSGAAVFDVQVLDQSGEPMLYGTYPLTASLSGPATFTDGTTDHTLLFTEDGSGDAAQVTVDAAQGQTGIITLTVSGTGLGSATGTITETADSPYALRVTGGTYVGAVNPTDPITAQIVDQYGNPVPDAGVAVNFSAVTNDPSLYPTPTLSASTVDTDASGAGSVTASVPPLVDSSNTDPQYTVTAAGTDGATLLQSGTLGFSVEHTVAGRLNITLKDLQSGTTQSFGTFGVTAGDEVEATVYAVDVPYGNPVTTGDTIDLSYSGSGSLEAVGGGAAPTSIGPLVSGAVTYVFQAAATGDVTITAQDASSAQAPTASMAVAIVPPGTIPPNALPEVPFAVGLPLVLAGGVLGGIGLRRRRRGRRS